MFTSILSEPDPYPLADITIALANTYIGRGNADSFGRTPAYPFLVPGENTGIFLGIGQSTMANVSVGQHTAVNARAQHLSIHDGGIYPCVDPLLGPDSLQGNWMSRFADNLITAGKYDRVIVVPIAVAGSSAQEWAPGGVCSHRIDVAHKRLLAIPGMQFTGAIYSRGETDNLNDTATAVTEAAMDATFAHLRVLQPGIPILVARQSWCLGVTHAKTRAAQNNVIDPSNGIYAGPDLDVYNNTYRFDTTHFNLSGNIAVSTDWANSVIANL